MQSSSVAIKVAFLLLALVIFMTLFRVGLSVLSWIMGPSSRTVLVNGMVDGTQLVVIPQNPTLPGSIPVPRSVNQTDGVEFTWSVWVYIEDLTYHEGQYRCLFYKGNEFAPATEAAAAGVNFPNNAPGLYLAPTGNTLVLYMNTFEVINEEIRIPDLPVNKWMHVGLRCRQTVLDVYINGTVVKSHALHGVPKQNYGNVYIGPNGGFSGHLSNLWYYSYALTGSELAHLAAAGPNTRASTTAPSPLTDPSARYLSPRWYLSGG
jgi:hypothetical protein